jgi:hypothetical protein
MKKIILFVIILICLRPSTTIAQPMEVYIARLMYENAQQDSISADSLFRYFHVGQTDAADGSYSVVYVKDANESISWVLYYGKNAIIKHEQGGREVVRATFLNGHWWLYCKPEEKQKFKDLLSRLLIEAKKD